MMSTKLTKFLRGNSRPNRHPNRSNQNGGRDVAVSADDAALSTSLGRLCLGPEELERQIQSLDGHDVHLGSLGLLVMLVVAGGFLALIVPNLMWGLGTLHVDGRYLPQLFFGFFVMIVLFNIYTFDRKRTLRRTRDELVRQLIRNQTIEMLSFLDPLTEIFNRHSMEDIIGREVARTERQGTPLTFVMIDVDRFKSVNTRFGHLMGDRVLNEIARLLKRTFRNSDYIIRYGGDEFLVVMTDTCEDQAERAVERLQNEVRRWNTANSLPGYVMGLSCGLSAYQRGADVQKLIEIADANMYVDKNCHMVPATT